MRPALLALALFAAPIAVLTAADTPSPAPAAVPHPPTQHRPRTAAPTTPSAAQRATHSRDYRFLEPTFRGRPTMLWPCRGTIRVIVNPRALPPGTLPAVREAAARISAVSGYRVQVAGTTRLRPTRTGGHPLPGQGGDRMQVLVAAAHPGTYGMTGTDTMATATTIAIARSAHRSDMARGVILVNTRIAHVPGWGQNGLSATLAHEFGHILGLDHVPVSTGQAMNPHAGAPLGTGDAAGLRALHHASCG